MADPLDSKTIAKLAFGLYPHVFQAADGQVDGEAIVERLKRIRAGFVPETEFLQSFPGWVIAPASFDWTKRPCRLKKM